MFLVQFFESLIVRRAGLSPSATATKSWRLLVEEGMAKITKLRKQFIYFLVLVSVFKNLPTGILWELAGEGLWLWLLLLSTDDR